MFQEVILTLVGAGGVVIGYGAKYFFDKKIFLYKRKIKAKEKLRDAFNILSQGHILCIQLQWLDLSKIEKADLIKQNKIQNALDALQAQQIAKRIADEMRQINIYNDIQPYVASDVWKLFYAYIAIITNAGLLISSIPYALDVIRKDKVEENIIKNVIPVIPEMEKFIKEAPISRIFFVEELVRKKLLSAIENLNRSNHTGLFSLFKS